MKIELLEVVEVRINVHLLAGGSHVRQIEIDGLGPVIGGRTGIDGLGPVIGGQTIDLILDALTVKIIDRELRIELHVLEGDVGQIVPTQSAVDVEILEASPMAQVQNSNLL